MPEFPHELIRQLQICTRAAAELPEYSPRDPTLPALPSLAATVAALEPSEPHLRCENCKGKLLRGIHSNICIYCGCRRRSQNDAVPEPISFASTTAYQYLLTSLGLDGSEMVKPPTSKTEQEQGRVSPKAALPLSDFLNYRIAWPAELEKEETSISDQHSEESRRSLSLSGISLDNFFPNSKSDVSVTSNQQPITHNQTWTTETMEVAAFDSPDLFQNVQSPDPAEISVKDKGIQVFSGWEADFQSADAENEHSVTKESDRFMGPSADSEDKVKSSESSNHFSGSEVDLGAHMDSVFGPGNDLNNEQPIDNPAASAAFTDWNSDGMWNNLGSNKSQLVGGFDDIVDSQDDHILKTSNNLSPNVDLLQDFVWQTNNTDVTGNTTTGNEHMTVNDESFDEWDDFTGSSSQVPSANFRVEGSDGNDLLSTFVSTNVTENRTTGNEHIMVNEESFDEWDDFTGSSSQVPSVNVRIEGNDGTDLLSSSDKKSSEIDLFGSNSKFEGDFGSFSEPNLFATSTSNINFRTEVESAIYENPASDSSKNATSTSLESGHTANSRDAFSKPTDAKDEVKMLISQMHDLSFMLETDLSIPSDGTDARKSSPRD